MTSKLLLEKVVVTFVEGAIAYFVVLPNPSYTKTAIAGAVAAGLSAVYNTLRESTPTTATPPLVVTPLAVPVSTPSVIAPTVPPTL